MTHSHNKTHDLVITAVFAALICAAAPFSVPVGPVPISLATLMIYIAAGVLGAPRATLAVCVYIALGALGLPVFSNFSGGLPKLVGATGGYIVGYIPLALISGVFFKTRLFTLGALAGTAVLYALGTAWFVFQTGNTLAFALSVCVVPFLIGDAAKIAVSAIISPVIRRQARL